jgi:phage shock protein PspC (stress-responsive transcriptional regulator)
MTRPLRRIREHKWIGGVCAGFAYALAVRAWVVRLVWTAAVLTMGFGFLLYVLFWVFMPKWDADPGDYDDVVGS